LSGGVDLSLIKFLVIINEHDRIYHAVAAAIVEGAGGEKQFSDQAVRNRQSSLCGLKWFRS
jgi:hypothetical protein